MVEPKPKLNSIMLTDKAAASQYQTCTTRPDAQGKAVEVCESSFTLMDLDRDGRPDLREDIKGPGFVLDKRFASLAPKANQSPDASLVQQMDQLHGDAQKLALARFDQFKSAALAGKVSISNAPNFKFTDASGQEWTVSLLQRRDRPAYRGPNHVVGVAIYDASNSGSRVSVEDSKLLQPIQVELEKLYTQIPASKRGFGPEMIERSRERILR